VLGSVYFLSQLIQGKITDYLKSEGYYFYKEMTNIFFYMTYILYQMTTWKLVKIQKINQHYTYSLNAALSYKVLLL